MAWTDICALCLLTSALAAPPTLWPQPLSAKSGSARAIVAPGKDFFTVLSGSTPATLEAAFQRYFRMAFPHAVAPTPGRSITGLNFVILSSDESYPQLDTDESYNLTVPEYGVAKVTASTIYGALRGLETFSQLVKFSFEEGLYEIQAAPWQISDKPRFPHRGLMIDTARHYLPLAFIQKIVDSLTYAKLNVLHWHMSDAQSFPFQSMTSPKLWDGAYSEYERYTQLDVASIVEYARMRGVRVIVEFDMPGHAASWCKGYPEICPSPTCTSPLNVASNETFKVIDGLIGELAGDKPLFPDNFIHLGGDEVHTACWSNTPTVAAWLKRNNMTADQAYGYFVKKVAGMAISRKHRPVQWSSVFDHFKGSLPKETIVHVYTRPTNVTEVVSLGYDVLRSVAQECWYLDYTGVKWDCVYHFDPCKDIPTDELCAKVLGGHGEMWGEHVDGSDLEQTVWPRLAAMAEMLWSNRADTQNITSALPRIRDFRCLLLQRGVAAAPVDNANARSAPDGPDSCYTQHATEFIQMI